MTEWKDFTDDKPKKGQICIGLHKWGMCFFEHDDNPLNNMIGLFYVPRNGSLSGMRYAVDNITEWVPLPEAYDS